MGYSDKVFEVVAHILLEAEERSSSVGLREFQDFVIALSIDSGLEKDEVQSILVDKMLQTSRDYAVDGNVIWLDRFVGL